MKYLGRGVTFVKASDNTLENVKEKPNISVAGVPSKESARKSLDRPEAAVDQNENLLTKKKKKKIISKELIGNEDESKVRDIADSPQVLFADEKQSIKKKKKKKLATEEIASEENADASHVAASEVSTKKKRKKKSPEASSEAIESRANSDGNQAVENSNLIQGGSESVIKTKKKKKSDVVGQVADPPKEADERSEVPTKKKKRKNTAEPVANDGKRATEESLKLVDGSESLTKKKKKKNGANNGIENEEAISGEIASKVKSLKRQGSGNVTNVLSFNWNYIVRRCFLPFQMTLMKRLSQRSARKQGDRRTKMSKHFPNHLPVLEIFHSKTI